MKSLILLLAIVVLSACGTFLSPTPNPTPTPAPTYTPYPTYTPNPTYTPIPADELFITAIYNRIEIDDTIPQYAQIRDVRDDCWLLGPELPVKAVKRLPMRATYEAQRGDLLLPRVYSSLHRAVMVAETEKPLIVSDAFALLLPRSREQGLVLLALLHHRILGEQLWAQSSGTMVRSVAASKVALLRVPQLKVDAQSTLAGMVEELLDLQETATFMPQSRIWLDGLPSNWRQRARKLAEAIEECIDKALGVTWPRPSPTTD